MKELQGQIREQMGELQRLYKELTADTEQKEEALCACVFYVTRLLNEVLQMSVGDMEYEQRIFCGAMTIFVKQFIEQVKTTKELQGDRNTYEYVTEKRDLVEDIENAVEKVLTTYRNVVDSVANMDRHMLVGLTAGVNAYDLSPKICAAYSYILNRLTELMGGEGTYAFLLNPTTKSIVRSEALLECRQEHGKVVIINIPERMVEKSDLLPVILIHEAYHVLTLGESRLRGDRAKSYIQNMYYEIENCLFRGTTLFQEVDAEKKSRNLFWKAADSEDKSGYIRERLMEEWFSEGKKELEIYLDEEEDSRQFYGKNMAEKVRSCMEKDLRKLPARLEEDVMGCFFEVLSSEEDKLECYEEQYNKAVREIDAMTKNLHAVLIDRKLDAAEELFLFMYREVYSDLACVMLLNLSAKQYNMAFDWSGSSRMPEIGYVDHDRLLRQYLVAKAYSDQLERYGEALSGDDAWWERCQEWKNMAEEKYDKIRNFPKETAAKGTLQEKGYMIQCSVSSCNYPEGIYLTEEILENLCRYFKVVADEFAKRIMELEGVVGFRMVTACLMQISSDDEFLAEFLLNGINALESGEGAMKKEGA